MGKSTPKAPEAPDPVATAQAQAEANKDAAITQAGLNRIDQYTPQGSLTYQQIGSWEDGTPRYAQTQAYSPEQQALYDQQNQVAQGLGGLAVDNIQRVSDAQSTPFSYDGMNPLQSVSPTGNMEMLNGSPQLQTSIPSAGNIQTGYDSGGQVQNSFDQGQGVQGNLNYSGLEAMPDASNFNQAAQTASDSAYSAVASRLDPQFSQRESDLQSRLAAQGITQNSDAYRREMDNLSRDRNDAYGQANWNAYQAGLAAQQQGYGQALSTRQQGVGEINSQGQFANAAAGQQYSQNQGSAAFNNDAQAQQNAQNAQAAQFGNQAQAQQYGQNAQGASFSNDALANQQNLDASRIQQNNSTATTQFNQDLASAQLNNNVRQQQIGEASYLRNLPINDIAALLGTGGGVQDPSFNSFAQVGVAAPDYQGAVYNSFNAQNQQYQQQMANQSAGLGGIFGLASSAMMLSDRRFKHAIKRVGTFASGVGAYVFKYLGDNVLHFGTMAQEVQEVLPEAVGTLPDGTLYVDYRKVW